MVDADEAFDRWRDDNGAEWDAGLERQRISMLPWLVDFWWKCFKRQPRWMFLKRYVVASFDLWRARSDWPVDPDVAVGAGCLLAAILAVVFAQ